ncbi:hypothetical protein GOODEAATRI_022046, partial [Goodea atripinnis]
IFLGSFRLPYEEIRDIVLEVDEERLSESLIQSVFSFSCGLQRPPPPIHPLIMDDEGQDLAKSRHLHPPLLLLSLNHD